MQEYINNGTRLSWLINPKGQQVEIYRQGQEKEILQAPTSLSGEQVGLLIFFVPRLSELPQNAKRHLPLYQTTNSSPLE